jgi:SAM-dependent methyltransferase
VAERTSGPLALLGHPRVYRAYHRLIGTRRRLQQAVLSHLQLRPGDRLLDIGCGPGDLLDDLTGVEYVGFDLSARYVEHARRRHGGKGSFFLADVMEVDPGTLGTFDAVLAHGVLHHLDDEAAGRLLDLAAHVVRPAGRFVSVDGCFADAQSRSARVIVGLDRGTAVRTPRGYERLARRSFAEVRVRVDHTLLRIPYSIAILDCTGPVAGPGPARDA